MTTFDLTEALAGRPVELACGVAVFQLHLFATDKAHCLYGVSEFGDVLSWTRDGHFGQCAAEYPDMNLRFI